MTTDAQTEARAIFAGLVIQFGSREGYDTAVNRLATALAAKDAELGRRDMQLEASAKVALELSAQLAEARKALERAERKLTAYVGVCPGDKELTETVLPMVRTARRALTGGQEDG